ncbi:MAG: ABC transporter substrate-binding protein, partial [Microcystis sp. M49637_WE12]|nr:ABC transporter substrate-binding protein [Microcystis sp. M49637_WE12]
VLSDPKTFNAVLSAESPNIFGLTYEGLLTENPITGKKEPVLAESWTISDDNLSIIFTMREGLKWSDGQPLTVDDVVFTYKELYLNPDIPNNYRDSLRIGLKKEFPVITKLDNRRIEFKLPEPFAPFLDAVSSPILPKHALEKTIQKKSPDGRLEFLSTWGLDTPPDKIVFNGAYKLKEYITGQRIIFENNSYYWKKDAQGQQLPHITSVIWAIVESQDTTLLQFRSGSLDSIGVTPEFFSLLKTEEERGNFTIFNGGPAYGTQFIGFNLNQGKRDGKPLVDPIKSRWFNNLNFRQAIAYGINRQRMIDDIYRGLGQEQNSFLSIQSPFYDQTLKGYDYNPEKAKELLLEAGFKYNSDNLLVDADNNPVRFNLITNAGNKIREAIGAQIKNDLAAIGIQVDFQAIAFSNLVDKLSNSLDWEAHILGFTGDNEPHAPNIWYVDGNLHAFNQQPQPGSPPIQGWQAADWEKKIADLYVKGSQELDFEKRKVIYNEIQKLQQEYVPF